MTAEQRLQRISATAAAVDRARQVIALRLAAAARRRSTSRMLAELLQVAVDHHRLHHPGCRYDAPGRVP